MKRLFIFITVVCALFVTSCYEDSTTNDRISNLENDKIASIEEQINAILSTLSVLKEETHPLILSKIGVLESNAESNAELIATLKAQAESVANQISELTNHCKQLEDSIGLYGEKEWIESTFATLEQYANMQSVVASLQANIAGLSEEVKNSIAEVENSMKSWISVQLSSYCTIAEMESKLAELRAENKDNDAAVANKIAELEKMFEAVYHEITEAYKQSIADAISNNNGEINKKIAKDIATAEARIDSKLETINAEINDIKERLHIVEVKVGDIESQITEINTTLGLLQKVDEILSNELMALEAESYELCQQYAAEIEALRVQIANLEAEKAQIQADMATNTANIEVLKDAHNACIELIQSLDSKISNITMEMHAYMHDVSMCIENIRAEQEMLKAQIATLQEYVEYELSQKADKDWAEATFATLEQYAQMQTLLDELQQQIASLKQDENEGGTNVDSSAIEDAIKAAEESMKDWVAEELAGYCTISQLEAKLEVLRKELDQNGAYTQDQIAGMEARIAELSEQLAAMMMAYQKALNDISAILHNYQAENDARIHDILAEMEEMQVRHTEDIAYIKNTIDKLWDFIYNRIQSITYIPQYTDEKATIVKSHNADEGIGELDFLVLPKQAVQTIQVSDVSMKAVETISRAVNFIDMPIISVKTSDLANGVLTVRVSGKNLGDDFYEGKKEFKATLIISNYESEISSEFITLTPQVEEGSTSTNNKIFYTSSDGKIVTPYATDVFGANIVSNTYENGQGVITFDGEVTTIGNYAFQGCDALTSVTIPDSVTTIGGSAFRNCSALTSVTIPDSVTKIGVYAFDDCDALTSVTIGNSVTTIGDYAFRYCKALTSVTIPDSVTKIGNSAFSNCSALTSVTIPDSVTTIGNGAFRDCSALTSVTIGNSVTKIGNYAFYNCDALISVTIPDSVTTIGECAFRDCDALTSITIPDSVTTIGSGAFASCDALKTFYGKFASEDNRCLIVDGVLNSFAPAGLTTYSILDSVTTIGEHAFSNCDALTSVTIPDSVTTIGEYAFYTCDALTSITIPDSVTTIGSCAFRDCDALTSVTIPDSVTKIGVETFYDCSSLTSVTIPDSVTTIGKCAFYTCTSLKKVYCMPTTPPSLEGSYVFDNNASGRRIYVPAVSLEAYKAAEGWKEYADSIVADAQYTEIYYTSTDGKIVEPSKTSAFIGCNIISNTYQNGKGAITIDGKATAIQEQAFWGCSTLKSITLPDTITKIEQYAFANCSSLTSIVIPGSVVEMRNHIFDNCTSLITATIGEGVTYISQRMFQGCTVLTNVNLPDSVTEIGANAFSDCIALKSITIPKNVQRIGGEAFLNCSSLKTVYCKPAKPFYPGYHVFDYINDNYYYNIDCKIYVPRASIDEYKSDLFWGDYKSRTYPYDFTE